MINKNEENALIENTNKKDEFVRNFLENNINKLYIDTSDSHEFLPSQANLICSNDDLENALIELVYHMHGGFIYKVLVDKDVKTIADKFKYSSIDKDGIISLVYETMAKNTNKEDPKKDLIPFEFKHILNGKITEIAKGFTPSKNELQLVGFAIADDKVESYEKNSSEINDKALSETLKKVANFTSGTRSEKSQPNNN